MCLGGPAENPTCMRLCSRYDASFCADAYTDADGNPVDGICNLSFSGLPLDIMGCIELKELLGLKANDEQKLLELIEEVPADSIYYHTHSYFLRHFYITGPYSNDFANWAVIQVRDRVLGEKLSCVTPSSNKSLEDIRYELIEILDEHLTDQKFVPAIV